MRTLLLILGATAFLGGISVLTTRAHSPLQEIEAFIVLLISAVLVSGAAILGALDIVSKKFDVRVGADKGRFHGDQDDPH